MRLDMTIAGGSWLTARGTFAYELRAMGLTSCARDPATVVLVQDEIYKRLFAFPRMVEDLMRGFAAREWAAEIDFSTLRKLPAEYVSDDLRKRVGDAVWAVRLRDGRHVLAMLEFQSRDDPMMALRILAYTSLLYQEVVRNDAPVLDTG